MILVRVAKMFLDKLLKFRQFRLQSLNSTLIIRNIKFESKLIKTLINEPCFLIKISLFSFFIGLILGHKISQKIRVLQT